MAETVVARLKAVLTGDSAGLRRDLDQSEKRLKAFGDKAGQVGRQMTTRLTLPLVGVGVAAVKTASDFERSMTSITALVGIASDEVKRMESDVRSMAVEFGKSGKEAADALFFITSAGLRGSVASDTLAASLKASAIGLGDTATIADLATSALNAYGADVLSAADATDVMTATVREGKLEASELAGSMGRVLPLASAMGVGFNEVGAAFAALSRTGTNAAEAATQIRGILASLLRPTKQAEEALTGMGLSSEGLRRQMREEGLLETLKTLSEEFAGNEAAAASVFGNIRALSGVLDLMGANVATTEAIFASMTDTTGAVDAAFAAVSETASFKFQQAMAETKDSLLTLGQELMPMVTDALGLIKGVIESVTGAFSGMSDSNKQMVTTLLGVAAVAGPVALGIAGISKALVALKSASPWVLGLTTAFTGLSIIMGEYYREAREASSRHEALTQEFKDAGDPAANLTDRLSDLADEIKRVREEAEGGADAIPEMIGAATLQGALSAGGVLDVFNEIGASVEDLIPSLEDGAGELEGLLQAFELGGLNMVRDELSNLPAEYDALSISMRVALMATEENSIAQIELMENYRKVVEALVQTGQAFDDNTAKIETDMQALIDSGDVYRDFAGLLGEDTVNALLAMVGNGKTATEVMEEIATRADAAMYSTRRYSFMADLAAGSSDNLSGSVAGAAMSFDDMARTLVAAGELAGYDIEQIAALADQIGILDGVSAEVRVELGLDVLGGDALVKLVDDIIRFKRESMAAAGLGQFMQQELAPLFNLRSNLIEALASGGSGGGRGGSGASNAVDEVAEAAKKAQEDVQRFGDSLAGFANRFLGRDFAEAMVEGSFDEITRVFRDLMDDVAYMMKDVTDKSLNAALGDLQGKFSELANLAKLRDELKSQFAEIQDVVADAKSAIKLSLKPDKGPNELSMFVQAQDQVAQAREFVQSLRRLKGLGLPASILQQVVGAGVVDGTLMAKQLMSLSPEDIGQLVSFTREIEQLQQQAGSLVGEALGSGTVEGELSATVDAMQSLTEAIQVDLYSAFATFIQDLGAEITNLKQPNGATAPTPTPAPETGGGTGGGSSKYTVKAGDGLWGIAQALLGSGSRWKEIAQLNGKNPDTYGTKWAISPGQVLDIPARAMGGSVSRNKPYLVGELGAELFVPNASGTIVPNGSFGGDTTINVTVNAGMGTDGANVGREIVKALNEYASTNTGRLAPSLVR